MKYKINIVPNGVAVDRITPREARKISLLTALTAFVIAAIGIAYLYYNRETENSVPYIAAGFGSLLGVACLVYTMFVGRLLRPLPEQVLFNNERAIVEIRHKASGAKKIEFPYSHVHTVELRTVSHWNASNKKSTIRYAVTLYLKDGSSWDLMEDSIMDSSYASDYADKIRNNASFAKASGEKVTLPKLETPRLSVVQRGDETQIRWRNNSPANTSRRLGIPILIMVLASFMSLMGEADEWSVLGDTIRTNVNSFGDLAKIPGLLGGLIFTAGIVFICLIVLLVQVILILRYRMKENTIIVNKSLIASEGSNVSIPIGSAGTASMTYCIGRSSIAMDIQRQMPSFKAAESTTFEGDLDFKTAMSMFGQSFKEGVKEAVQETFRSKDDGTDNFLAEFTFDRFSPIDVYVVKESIRLKLVAHQGLA